ncbi:MAG TPA: hypothetical protein PLD84_16315, partial [Chitinophagales bacterium]|nr:hypothetical protein [Chitinophagales bacterium]
IAIPCSLGMYLFPGNILMKITAAKLTSVLFIFLFIASLNTYGQWFITGMRPDNMVCAQAVYIGGCNVNRPD